MRRFARLLLDGFAFLRLLALFRRLPAGFFPARLMPLRLRMMMVRLLLLLALRLNPAQRTAQLFNLAFIRQFLAFSDLDEFQNLVHLIVQFLQRLGNKRGVFHRLRDGRGRGGTEIRGLHPLLLPGRFGTAFLPVFAALLALRHGSADGFRFRSRRHFRGGFRFGRIGRFHGIGLMRGKFGGDFRMRFAKAAGRVRFRFHLLDGIHGFHGSGVLLDCFR